MRLSPRSAAAFGLVFGAASLASAADPQVVTSYDLPFSSAGGVELRLDVAQPAMGRAPYPAVVVLHAGAWREGSKDENRRLLFDLARRGYVGVSPDYRLCPQSVFPAQVEDAKAAVRFLRANAASLNKEVQTVDRWLLNNMLLHVALSIDHVTQRLLPLHLGMIDRRWEQLEHTLRQLPPDAVA